MTKQEYINNHPKSHLAQALKSNDWPADTEIKIVGGLEAPENKQSNLYAALETAKMKKYVRGGHRQRGTEGWWFAVA